MAEHRSARGRLLARIAQGSRGTRALSELLAGVIAEAEASGDRVYEVKARSVRDSMASDRFQFFEGCGRSKLGCRGTCPPP